MTNSLTTTGNKIDSWKQLWSMPGGTFAKITAVGATLGIGYGFFKALPMLIMGAANTLVFIAELIAIAGIIFVLTSKNFWKWISLFWLQINRKIVGAFVKIDPISILENGIYELSKKYDIVCENVTKLGGILKTMEQNLKKYQDEFDDKVSRRATLQKLMNDPSVDPNKALEQKTQFILNNNEIVRLEKIITAQQKRITTSKKYLDVMKKLKIVAKSKIDDSKSEMRFRKEEYESALAQTSALKSIKSIMSGGLSKSLEEELALNYVTETVNFSISEMNELLDGSNDLLVNFEVDSLANIDKVDAIISRFEQNGFESFGSLPSTTKPAIEGAKYEVVAEPVKVAARNNYF